MRPSETTDGNDRRCPWRTSARRCRFNEAVGNYRRKLDPDRDHYDGPRIASMRPSETTDGNSRIWDRRVSVKIVLQ